MLPTFSVYIHGSSILRKPYGIKLRWNWEFLREPLRTHWEKGQEKQKNPSPHPAKKKNWTSHECIMLSLLIGCMKPLFPKLFVTIFGTNCGTEWEVREITGPWAPPGANRISGKPHPTSSFGC
jgi:hypothetical protein